MPIPTASVGVERLFNMARDICSYRRHNLKPDTIRALVISMCTDHYLLSENLQIIKASNSAEEEALPEEIDDDELREIEIHGLISDDEEDTDLDEDSDGSSPSTRLPLPRQQGQPERPLGISNAERLARLNNRVAQKSLR
jgi:hypothetical protein